MSNRNLLALHRLSAARARKEILEQKRPSHRRRCRRRFARWRWRWRWRRGAWGPALRLVGQPVGLLELVVVRIDVQPRAVRLHRISPLRQRLVRLPLPQPAPREVAFPRDARLRVLARDHNRPRFSNLSSRATRTERGTREAGWTRPSSYSIDDECSATI